jgi:glycosyltransferase involved in cell wall biosynthesis
MNSNPPTLRGDADTPRPLRAKKGRLKLEGWCLLSGEKKPPAVRLSCDAFTLPITNRVDRPDLATQMPDQSAALNSGFSFDEQVPPGIHLARLEGQSTDGSWQTFKTLCLAVESVPFSVGLDSLVSSTEITKRIHLEGWALHPEKPVESLTLRYGHRELTCRLGKNRRDLPSLYPQSPHAKQAGFKSATILDAGYGALRVKATFADSSIAIASTPYQVAIASDENVGAEIDLQGTRIGFPKNSSFSELPALEKTSHPLNVLFVLHGSFASNSALHVTALANELATMGHSCTVAVTHDIDTLKQYRVSNFTAILHTDADQSVIYPNETGPDIIHAWTTRENVRILTDQLRRQHSTAKVLIHLEDNEQHILAEQLGLTKEQLDQSTDCEWEKLISSDLSHPQRSLDFLSSCDGMTIINENLNEFVPANHPHHLLWPAADSSCFYERLPTKEFRHILDRAEDETVLFYHGNVHASNAAEVKELYLAIEQLNREGFPTTLIRTGLDTVDFLQDLAPKVAQHVLTLGQIPHHHHLPDLMALADFFVQPGTADTFNDYRFPSKLPEFFSIGRPVILPRTNLGQIVRHGKDAYVLENADATGITRAIKELRADPNLRKPLSQGALAFAEKHFSWRRSAESLAEFYMSLIKS